MQLTSRDLSALVELRHNLHMFPEVSGEEVRTAEAVVEFLEQSNPDRVISGLGGHGVAAIFEGNGPGPTVLIRSELDALPIEEISNRPYRSTIPGVGHQCGHDGHASILAGVALMVGKYRPREGRVVLLWQPAEETGEGAAAVIADPRFSEITPDFAFALHNMPGMPLGHVGLSVGPVNCASRGMLIRLQGHTAHSSMPETGVSPSFALAQLIPTLSDLSAGDSTQNSFRLVTATHAQLGTPAFGIAPGHAELWVTLRTLRSDEMASLVDEAEKLVESVSSKEALEFDVSYHEIFDHCENNSSAVEILRNAMDTEGIRHGEVSPMRASEDFGRFAKVAQSAMFLLGAGESAPQLHTSDYDFPDELIEPSVRIFVRVIHQMNTLHDFD